MPTYEYECRKCGYQFDRFQSITAAPLKTCPKCHGRVHRMLTTGSGIIFKGSGFYCTDYKGANASDGAHDHCSCGCGGHNHNHKKSSSSSK